MPLIVPEEIKSSEFIQAEDEFYLSGEVIELLEKQVALDWIKNHGPDDITSEVLHGFQLISNVNATEFAYVLGISKSQLTKLYQGNQELKPYTKKFAYSLIRDELRDKGTIRKVLEGEYRDDLGIPKSDIKKLLA